MNHGLSSLTHGDIKLTQVTHIDGVPHVTRRAVGEWLEYPDPKKAMGKILERNAHIENYSVVVKLTTTDGKNYDTRVYHPIGFMMLVFESGQPKAKAMKEAVAKFVWDFSRPSPLSRKEELDLMKHKLSLVREMGRTKDKIGREVLANSLWRVCALLGEPLDQVGLVGTDPDQRELKLA